MQEIMIPTVTSSACPRVSEDLNRHIVHKGELYSLCTKAKCQMIYYLIDKALPDLGCPKWHPQFVWIMHTFHYHSYLLAWIRGMWKPLTFISPSHDGILQWLNKFTVLYHASHIRKKTVSHFNIYWLANSKRALHSRFDKNPRRVCDLKCHPFLL